MKEFLAKIKRLGVCEQYADKVERLGSKKQMLDCALEVAALPFICSLIARGELTSETICKEFQPFLNGRYISQQQGYSSALYCDSEAEIDINTTCALIVDCRGVINVNRAIAELYVVNSDICVRSDGRVRVYACNSTVGGNIELVKD